MSEVAPKSGEFSDGKFWFTRKGTLITVGVTSGAIEDIGAVESIDLPEAETDFDKGEVVVTVEGTRGSLEVITPAAGLIQEVNDTLKEEPDRLSEDPLEEGWLVKIEIQDTTDLKEFISD
jgi:glycine cleavage system H protein